MTKSNLVQRVKKLELLASQRSKSSGPINLDAAMGGVELDLDGVCCLAWASGRNVTYQGKLYPGHGARREPK